MLGASVAKAGCARAGEVTRSVRNLLLTIIIILGWHQKPGHIWIFIYFRLSSASLFVFCFVLILRCRRFRHCPLYDGVRAQRTPYGVRAKGSLMECVPRALSWSKQEARSKQEAKTNDEEEGRNQYRQRKRGESNPKPNVHPASEDA